MEVCGTHTMAIAKYGLRQLIPENIELISGPGCPVCVTPVEDIDNIISIIQKYGVVLFTFGDLMRVPGTNSSLMLEKSRGKNIKVCYSPADALIYARKNSKENILLAAIGFETTAPLTAILIKEAYDKNISNFFIFSTHKTVPPALNTLLMDKNIEIGGFLLPGHVSSVIGTKMYENIVSKFGIPSVVSGFEPEHILKSIYLILKQIKLCKPEVKIQYSSVVKPDGNPVALNYINEVFEAADTKWRGLGVIPKSGLELKKLFSSFDAKKVFPVDKIISKEPKGCDCGKILKGIKKPTDCKQFLKKCTPDKPLGACMVSSEGTCAAYFKYLKKINN